MLHDRGRVGSVRTNGAFTAGFQSSTCGGELALTGAAGARVGCTAGVTGTEAGAACEGCWVCALKTRGKDNGLASTTEPSDVRVQPEVNPQHIAAAMKNPSGRTTPLKQREHDLEMLTGFSGRMVRENKDLGQHGDSMKSLFILRVVRAFPSALPTARRKIRQGFRSRPDEFSSQSLKYQLGVNFDKF